LKFLVMTMRRPDFDPAAIPDHYHFLQDLRDRGLLEQAGPFADASGGAYVLKAASFDEAKRLAEQDPLHLRGCSTVTVHAWDAK
jgi:uncharacterized protein YciI